MELLERSVSLTELSNQYASVEGGNGHTIFLMGEAGIGKTSLVNHFVKLVEAKATIYYGACDSLFTPRPLGPLFDIAGSVGDDFIHLLRHEKDRSMIFAAIVQKLAASVKPVVLIFEDIHWADEATVDLIKYLARRIYRYRCLFLLTYRDDEIHSQHPLHSIFGELPSAHFSKVPLSRFTHDIVNKLAIEKGLASGDRVYSLTAGNPFYVMEILNSDSNIPDSIKDSILTLFHSRGATTKELWEFLSVFPSSRIYDNVGRYVEKNFGECLDESIRSGLIIFRIGHLSFKHELFRLAIEESLSPLKKKRLHKMILDLLLEDQASYARSLPELVHHARYAEERELVAKIAPQAAAEAANVGAHIESSKLYLTAIEYTNSEVTILVDWYERHAYECYLTNQIAAAIQSQQKALDIWRERKVNLREGDALRFLSRLWWFEGDQEKAMSLGIQAINVLENGFPTRERALAYSNLSQLYMLCENQVEAVRWGNLAIELATRMEDYEILSHALNNVGNIEMLNPKTATEGEEKLNQSLSLALQYGFQEHVARAYTNLSSTFALSRRYERAMDAFNLGLKYCEERDLSSWKYYMLSDKAQLLLELGRWDDAEEIATGMLQNPHHPNIVKMILVVTLARLNIRKGKFLDAERLIGLGKSLAIPTREAQRVIPVLTTELELCWITGVGIPLDLIQEAENDLFYDKNNSWHYSELAFWMRKCGVPEIAGTDINFNPPFDSEMQDDWSTSAEMWKKIGNPYYEALALSHGNEDCQKEALSILDRLGATATQEMVQLKLRQQGVRNIPRGPRESTRNNPAQLTNRQIDILLHLNEGLQNAEIGKRLFISSKTVDHHISAILSKLGVNTRTKAVSEARKLGVLNK